MGRIDISSHVAMEFELSWKSADARHAEQYLAWRSNLWRDEFPPAFKEALLELDIGQSVRKSYAAGEAMPDRDERRVVRVPRSAFRRPAVAGRIVTPRLGRFYPRGLIEGLPGVFPQDVRPVRIVAMDDRELVIDLNHPMAGRDFSLEARLLDAAPKASEAGGRLNAWLEEICDYGPGMQVRAQGQPTDFSLGGPRLDESDDAFFHAAPRLVGHVDAQADQLLTGLLAGRLAGVALAGGRVLDLMSAMQSHLPLDAGLRATGLGMNAEELAANPLLTERIIHDLNRQPLLPFPDASFEATVINLSIEYLTDPLAVLAECRRVLVPGGRLLVSFSNRWFPAKATLSWLDLHEFERMGLVLELFRRTGGFEELETVSVRNWRRPADDPHIRRTLVGDPVYLVAGTRR